MFVVSDRDGRVVALTTEDNLVPHLMTQPSVSQIRRISEMESIVADSEGFEKVPVALQVARLKQALQEAGVESK